MNAPASDAQLSDATRTIMKALPQPPVFETVAQERLHRKQRLAAGFRLFSKFGFDEGVTVEPLHLGPFGRDPLAIRVGRMTVAIRRSHARAVLVLTAA